MRLHLPCEERAENWGLFSFGEEAALGGDGDFSQWCTVGRQDNSEKLIKERCRLNARENIFTVIQRGCDVSVLAYFQELVG